MGVLDKIMFWKKKDEFDFGDMGDAGGMGGMPGMGQDMGGMGQTGIPEGSMQPGAESAYPGAAPRQPPMLEPAGGPESPQSFGRFQQQPAAPQQVVHPESVGKAEVEIISVKIDNLRTTIEVVNQRLERIERMLEEQAKKRAGW